MFLKVKKKGRVNAVYLLKLVISFNILNATKPVKKKNTLNNTI